MTSIATPIAVPALLRVFSEMGLKEHGSKSQSGHTQQPQSVNCMISSLLGGHSSSFPPSYSRRIMPLPKEKFAKRAVSHLDPVHLQPGSLHITYEAYDIIKLPGPEGDKGIYIPCGNSVVLAAPYRKVVFSKDVLMGIKGEGFPAAHNYKDSPEGVYVPASACIVQRGNGVVPMKVDMSDDEDVTLTVRPLHKVVVVAGGKVKSVLVTPQNFLFDGTPEQVRSHTLENLTKTRLVRKHAEILEETPEVPMKNKKGRSA